MKLLILKLGAFLLFPALIGFYFLSVVMLLLSSESSSFLSYYIKTNYHRQHFLLKINNSENDIYTIKI